MIRMEKMGFDMKLDRQSRVEIELGRASAIFILAGFSR